MTITQLRAKAKKFLKEQEEWCGDQDAYDESYEQGYANQLILDFLSLTDKTELINVGDFRGRDKYTRMIKAD